MINYKLFYLVQIYIINAPVNMPIAKKIIIWLSTIHSIKILSILIC